MPVWLGITLLLVLALAPVALAGAAADGWHPWRGVRQALREYTVAIAVLLAPAAVVAIVLWLLR